MAINLNHPTNTIDGTSVLNVNSGDGENIELNPDSGLVNVNGNINIVGNFTVQGTTTTINSTTSSIVDPIILLGTDENGNPASTVDSKDRGVAFYYNDGAGNKTGFLGYDRGTGYFRFVPDATISGEIVSGSDGTIKIDTLESTTINTVDLNVSNDTAITGDLTVGGHVIAPTTEIGDLNFSTNTISSDSTGDIVLDPGSNDIDVTNSTIKNLLDPTNLQDAATKNYVDTSISSDVNLEIAADTGTGTINLDTETLTINGTIYQIETNITGNVITITLPTNMTVPGSLSVTTDLVVTGTTTLNDPLTVNDTASITGNTDIGGTLDVTLTSNFQGDVTVQTNLHVLGNTDIDGDLNVDGNITLGGNITIGDQTLDTVTVVADFTSNLIPDVDSTYDIGETLKRWRTLYADNIDVNDLLINDTLTVTGDTIIGGTLQVTGATTLNDPLTVNDTASITGNTDIGGTLQVTGATTLNDPLTVNDTANITGNTDIGGALQVTGATTLNSNLSVDGDTSLTGTLGVSGATSIANTLGVLDAVSFDSSLDVYGSTTLHSTLAVTGATTLNDPLTVNDTASITGNTDIGGELQVTGATTLNSTLSVTNNATFSSDVTVTGNLNVMGTLTSINTADTTIKDNFITLNDGETNAGVTAGYSGIEIDRGSEPNALLWWNEGNDFWEVGVGESYANLAANNLYLAGSAIVEGSITSASLTASNLTETRVVLAGVDGQLTDSSQLTFTGTGMYLRNNLYINEGNNIIASGNIDVVGEVTAANVTVTTLDEDRIPFADANGRLVDSPSLTFDVVTALLSVPNISASNQIYAVTIKDEHLTPGRITFAGSGKELVDSELLTFDATSGALTVDGLTFDNTTISAVADDIILDPGIYNIDVTNSRITNVANPIDPQDVTTKSWVETTIENNSNLAIAGTFGSGTVNLATETLTVAGTSNQITTIAAGQAITVSLPNAVVMPGSLEVTTTLDVTAHTNLSTLTGSGSATLDSLSVTNDLSVGGNTSVTGDTIIYGNLTVQGTTTSVQSVDTIISDNIITLNDGELGAGVSAGYSGILVDRGTEPDTVFQWNELLDRWEIKEGSNLTNFAALEADIGDVNISGNTITTTEPNGDLIINSNGTGQVIVNGEPVVTGLDSIVYAIVFGG